jgi:hypothetical protein
MDVTGTFSNRQDRRARADKQLNQAIQALGNEHVNLTYARSPDEITAVTLGERARALRLGPWTVPLDQVPDEAAAFETALARLGVTATVSIIGSDDWDDRDPAFRIAFHTLDDTKRFAREVITHLPEPAATTHRLQHAHTRAGIDQKIRFSFGHVELGTFEAVNAVALCSTLGHPVGTTLEQDVDTAEWPLVEDLAVEVSAALTAVLRQPLSVDSVPVCRTCTRDNQMDLGSITVATAWLLIDALNGATAPTADPSDPAAGRSDSKT